MRHENTVHERISIHQICFAGATLPAFLRQCDALGARRVSLIGQALLEPQALAAARTTLAETALTVQAIAHVFTPGPLSANREDWRTSRDALTRLIDDAALLGARSIYMLTGGHGNLRWEEAAECFSAAIAPCVDHARAAGVGLAIENASTLYADLHIAHSLADTLALAATADVGVCMELFFCWAEAGLPALVARALPRLQLVQVSDYVYGDRSLPARAVPGDGAMPLQSILSILQDAGYAGAFDLELLGPRIDAEGHAAAVARAAAHVGGVLAQLQG